MTPKTKSEETAREIIDDWNSGEESTEDTSPKNPDGPYFAHLERRITTALRERDEKVEDSIKVVEALMKIEEQFPEPWWCVGKPSDLAEHIVSRFTDLRAKLAEAEKWMRHKTQCRALIHIDGCRCGLDAFKASLTTLGGKGE